MTSIETVFILRRGPSVFSCKASCWTNNRLTGYLKPHGVHVTSLIYIYIYVCVCVSVNFGWWYSIRCQRQTSLSVLSLNRLTDTGILLCTCRCWFVYVQVCNCMAQQSARHIRIYYGYPLLYLTHSHPWRAIHNTFSKQCAHISILIPLPFIHWFAIIGRIQSNDILTEHFHCGLLGKQTRYIYMRTLMPEAGISGRDKLLHPAVYCGM